MKTATIIILTIFLSGCGLQWINRVNPNASFEQDEYACKTEAIRLFPNVKVPSQRQPPTYSTNCTSLGGFVDCTSRPMAGQDTTSIAIAQNYQDMTTNNARSNLAGSCIRARGWSLEKKPK
jgi:hypothetical protein